MAVRVNLVMNQGEDFSSQVILQDSNGNNFVVSGYTAAAGMRKHYGAANAVAITASLSNGYCNLSMTSAGTANVADGRWVYDVVLIDSANTRTRIVEGIITVKPAATYWTGWPTPTPGADNTNPAANNAF